MSAYPPPSRYYTGEVFNSILFISPNTNYVTLDTQQNITGIKTVVTNDNNNDNSDQIASDLFVQNVIQNKTSKKVSKHKLVCFFIELASK